MTELINAVGPSVNEIIDDPQATVGDLVTTAGFEGLSAEARLEVIEKASLDDYISSIDLVHRKVAPNESHEFNDRATSLVDPNTGEIRHSTAQPHEREDILQRALDNAQSVVAKYRQEGGDTEDVLRRCSNLAAFGILLAHPYGEGNGRVARTIGELIDGGYDRADQDTVDNIVLLSTNRPSDGFRINSYTPSGEWVGRANEQPMEFLDFVAALDQPFDTQGYTAAMAGSIITPRM